MKFNRVLSASVLACAVIFTSTACSPTDNGASKETPTTTATSTPSASETSVPTASATVLDSETKQIINSVSSYYDFVAFKGAADMVKQVSVMMTPTPTDDKLKEIVSHLRGGFVYFDTSSSENILNTVSQLGARAIQSERNPGVTVEVPADAVSINGDTATVDTNKVLVTVNGVTGPATKAPYFEMPEINLVKKSDGSWGIIPEAPRQSIP